MLLVEIDTSIDRMEKIIQKKILDTFLYMMIFSYILIVFQALETLVQI